MRSKNPYLPAAPDDGQHVFSTGPADLGGNRRCWLCGAYQHSAEAETPCRGEYAESGKMRHWAHEKWNAERSQGCVFCELIQAELDMKDVLVITPLNPVTDGHLLFISREHVKDALEDPEVTARVMKAACEWAASFTDQCNIITSAGSSASQTVFHLHIHVVPRRAEDGLLLPWDTHRIRTTINDFGHIIDRLRAEANSIAQDRDAERELRRDLQMRGRA